MPRFSSDVLIKTLRKNRGLTQQELAEGICTQDTLSRIERGVRRPDWYTFERLMQRLGEDPNKYYYDIVTASDKRILDIKDNITNLLRGKNNEEAEKEILKLEIDEDFKQPLNLQFKYRVKAVLAVAKKDYESTYMLAVEGIKITKPDFNEEEIDKYILSYEEIMLINSISVASFHTISVEKSTDILLKLKESIDRGYVDEVEKSKTYLSILYNISKNLGLLKKYEQCIEICDTGLKYCTIYRNSHFHPLFLYNKTYALLYSGKMKEGEELFKTTCALFRGLERFSELASIQEFILKEFNIVP